MEDSVYKAYATLPDGHEVEVFLRDETHKGVAVAIHYDYAIPEEFPEGWLNQSVTIRGGTRIRDETRSGTIIEMKDEPKGKSSEPFWLLVRIDS